MMMMMMMMINMSGMENHPTHIQSCLFPDIFSRGGAYELPIFTIISFSRESTKTRFLEFVEQDFCHLPGKSNIWEIWEYEKLQDRPVDLEKQQKTHGTCEKHGHFVSCHWIFCFDRRIRRPRHRSPKVRRQSYRHSTHVGWRNLKRINHFNNIAPPKKHIEKIRKVMSHYFSEMLWTFLFCGGFGIWWIIRWDVPKLEKWSDLLCSAGACIKNVWDSFEIYMLCMCVYIYIYIYTCICYAYFFTITIKYHAFFVCICISMCALGPSLAI